MKERANSCQLGGICVCPADWKPISSGRGIFAERICKIISRKFSKQLSAICAIRYAVTLCNFMYLYIVSELNTALLPVHYPYVLSITTVHLHWSLRAMISVYLFMRMCIHGQRIVEILHAKMR